MSGLNWLSERSVRIQKAENIRKLWVIPYASKFDKKYSNSDLIKIWEEKEKLRDSETIILWVEKKVSTAWRLTLLRPHWKLTFATLLDETGSIQLLFHKDTTKIIDQDWNAVEAVWPENLSAYKFVEKYLDIADFIGVEWELFYTHKWELSIFVSEFTLLTKTILPLWDKFHWVNDHETLYRKRYLDMILHEDTLKRMRLRSDFTRSLREFYRQEWFMEVETPILWNFASGAAAQPFSTHHNDLDIELFLRISPETALKKATAWMFEKVFEIAKDFRNEWTDPSHLQEFTMVEHYAAYRNFEDNIKFTEKMFDYLFEKLNLPKKVMIKNKLWIENEVNFQTPRKVIDYVEMIKEDCWLDVSQYKPEDADKLREEIKKSGHSREWIDNQWTATLIDYLYKKVSRPKIIWPAFISNYPKTMQPLARGSDKNPSLVEQFQVVVNGREIIKAYSELVDPIQQTKNFEDQIQAQESWDEETTKWDPEFIEAMEHWMPPQSWLGMWIDRLLTLLTGQDNIRDVVLFPLMRPEN